MVDTNNKQIQSGNQSNQQTSSPMQSVEQPSIPSAPDQSLSSNINKGLNNKDSIPNKPDQSLNSSRTMNEQGLKSINGRHK